MDNEQMNGRQMVNDQWQMDNDKQEKTSQRDEHQQPVQRWHFLFATNNIWHLSTVTYNK